MTALIFAPAGDVRTGIDRGVLYFGDAPGIAWNGLVNVDEEKTDAESKPRYYDGIPYSNDARRGEFNLKVDAYVYPLEIEGFIFNFSYRENGNVHLVYNVTASPTSRSHRSNSAKPEAEPFTWEFSTVPIKIPNLPPAAHLYVDTSRSSEGALTYLFDMLYGTEDSDPRMPTPEELVPFFEEAGIFIVVDHGDGTWTASGPDDMIQMLDETTFQINSPSANFVAPDRYTLESTG